MTYGEYLRFCRNLAGSKTKTDFARELGMKDGDHYIGAENDNPTKKPSLDLMERAARLAGLEFTDFIQAPKRRKISREHEQLHAKLQDLLETEGENKEAAIWIEGNILTFHKAYFHRR